MQSRLYTGSTLVIVLVADQLTKYMARTMIVVGAHLPVVGNYFSLTRTENTGSFLGLGNSLPPAARFILLTALPLMVLLIGTGLLFRRKNIPPMPAIAYSLILAGGYGNVWDRMRFGSVTDFMHIDLILVQTGIFNVADMAIMAGVAILLIRSVFSRQSKTAGSNNRGEILDDSV